jgi:hypothetical protein
MERDVIVGTGFYATAENHWQKRSTFARWLINTKANVPPKTRVLVVDNSHSGLPYDSRIRILNNLGHVASPQARFSQFNGWSMSWILPALVAYSEGCDFVYKEQDCFAFNDWLPAIRKGRAAFGNHKTMECEQSLFWIERDFIPDFVQVYLSIPEPDCQCLPERKFQMVQGMCSPVVQRFDIGPGRCRPLPDITTSAPWYAQQLTDAEVSHLIDAGLL